MQVNMLEAILFAVLVLVAYPCIFYLGRRYERRKRPAGSPAKLGDLDPFKWYEVLAMDDKGIRHSMILKDRRDCDNEKVAVSVSQGLAKKIQVGDLVCYRDGSLEVGGMGNQEGFKITNAA